jgi:hypothetical protein
MGFGNFKTDAEVAEKFNLIIKEGFFLETLPFQIPEDKRQEIKELLDDPLAYVSEAAICEDIIKPILRVLDKAYGEFRVWSHIVYDVDASLNLSGTPDFLIGRPKKVGLGNLIDVPPLCVIEAKKRDWDNAWGQALAESYAASMQGATMCYAIITDGKQWQFGQYTKESSLFLKDKRNLSAQDAPNEENLQKLFDTLNWIFAKASKVVIDKSL